MWIVQNIILRILWQFPLCCLSWSGFHCKAGKCHSDRLSQSIRAFTIRLIIRDMAAHGNTHNGIVEYLGKVSLPQVGGRTSSNSSLFVSKPSRRRSQPHNGYGRGCPHPWLILCLSRRESAGPTLRYSTPDSRVCLRYRLSSASAANEAGYCLSSLSPQNRPAHNSPSQPYQSAYHSMLGGQPSCAVDVRCHLVRAKPSAYP